MKPVAIPRPLAGTFVPLGADQLGNLRVHQRLGEHTHALSQHVPILLPHQLANQR